MPKILTRLRIDEVSAVDRGAGEGVKIILMKRHDTGRTFNDFMKADVADDGGNDAGGGDITNHPVVQAARLLVASGKFGDHGQALDFLLNKPAGQALLSRMKAAEPAKESPMKDTSEHLDIIMKRFGPVEFAKHIVETGSAPCTEAEFVSAVTKHAHALRPELRPDSAFAKLYEAEESVRRACNVLKAMPFVADLEPLMVGGAAAENLNDPSAAIAQLKELGRRKWPTASEAQQFANAMTDPNNAALAAKAHVRPRPTTSYQMPR